MWQLLKPIVILELVTILIYRENCQFELIWLINKIVKSCLLDATSNRVRSRGYSVNRCLLIHLFSHRLSYIFNTSFPNYILLFTLELDSERVIF